MTMVVTSTRSVLRGAGIGLRLPHIVEVVATQQHVGWLEFHPENFLANPHAVESVTELSKIYPISLHSVGISVGTASGIDRLHLTRIGELVDRIDPVFISGHLAWSMRDTESLNDLLPLPFNMEALELVATHINEVQDTLRRPYLVENPASYVGFRTTTTSQAQFLAELGLRTGCRHPSNVTNVYGNHH